MDLIPRIEIDGREATAEQLRFPAFAYGHFTAMQVRGGSVRGLSLHLQRLDAGNRELFGVALDGDRVRDRIRHALGDDAEASVRVYVASSDADEISIMVTLRPPIDLSGRSVSLRSVLYQRSLPHTKHLADFGQTYYGRLATRAGFDDALLTGPGGVISECAIANIAFFDGRSVVWPDAPALQGITMQLLEPRLRDGGLPTRRGAVRLADVGSYTGAFVTNARGIAPVGRIDDRDVPAQDELMKRVMQVFGSVPWDPI